MYFIGLCMYNLYDVSINVLPTDKCMLQLSEILPFYFFVISGSYALLPNKT